MLQPLNGTLRLLRLNQVLDRTGESKSALYEKMAKGLFPANIKIGLRAVGWLESEINAYLETKVAQSRSQVKEAV